jgi:hypothetical protein
MRRLKDEKGRPDFNVRFYAVNKNGVHGSASIYDGGQYAVHDGSAARLLPSAYLYKK